jgi:hypothetical protein
MAARGPCPVPKVPTRTALRRTRPCLPRLWSPSSFGTGGRRRTGSAPGTPSARPARTANPGGPGDHREGDRAGSASRPASTDCSTCRGSAVGVAKPPGPGVLTFGRLVRYRLVTRPLRPAPAPAPAGAARRRHQPRQRTATVITSGGNPNPAKQTGRHRGGWLEVDAPAQLPHPGLTVHRLPRPTQETRRPRTAALPASAAALTALLWNRLCSGTVASGQTMRPTGRAAERLFRLGREVAHPPSAAGRSRMRVRVQRGRHCA